MPKKPPKEVVASVPAQPAAVVPWSLVSVVSWNLRLSEQDAVAIGELAAKWAPFMFEGTSSYGNCESPAERLFLLGFRLGSKASPTITFAFDADDLGAIGRIGVSRTGSVEPETLGLFQQQEIAGCRVDFLIAADHYDPDCFPPAWGLAIEIDGHEFHERTKEQAANDRRRDRALAAAGITPIRFTGSEVYAAPAECVREAVGIALKLYLRDDCFEKHASDSYRRGHERGFAAGEKQTLELLSANEKRPVALLPAAPADEAAE